MEREKCYLLSHTRLIGPDICRHLTPARPPTNFCFFFLLRELALQVGAVLLKIDLLYFIFLPLLLQPEAIPSRQARDCSANVRSTRERDVQ